MRRILFAIAIVLPHLALAQSTHWARIPIAQFFRPMHLVFVDSMIGYVGGESLAPPTILKPFGYYRLFRTSNAGENWTEIDPKLDTSNITSIANLYFSV